MYIHYYSHHAPAVKKGVLKGLFLRALRVSSAEYLQPELDILWAAFRRLGYPVSFIRETLSSAKTKFYSQPPPIPIPPPTSTPNTSNTSLVLPTPTPNIHPNPKQRTIILPYHPAFSKLNYHLRSSNLKIIFNYSDTINKLVVERRGSMADIKQHQSGVYQIPCKYPDCDLPYYGRTAFPLEDRVKHHKGYISIKKQDSALVRHIQTHPGHEPDFDAANIIWKTKDITQMQVVESACISVLPSCNISIGEIKVNPMLASVITHIASLTQHTDTQVKRPLIQ